MLKPKIVEMISQKMGDTQIAKALKCNKSYVRRTRVSLGLPSPTKKGRQKKVTA